MVTSCLHPNDRIPFQHSLVPTTALSHTISHHHLQEQQCQSPVAAAQSSASAPGTPYDLLTALGLDSPGAPGHLQAPPSPPPPATAAAAAQPAAEVVTPAAAAVNAALHGLGIQQQLDLQQPGSAVQCLSELLRLHADVCLQAAELQECMQKLKVDARAAHGAAERAAAQSEARKQQVMDLQAKARQLDAWYQDEVQRWAAEREELLRHTQQLEFRHVQFEHELRRKDAEKERLQERLRQQLSGTRPPAAPADVGSTSSSSAGVSSCKRVDQAAASIPRARRTPLK